MADFVDTNILLYAISGNPMEIKQRDIARNILLRDDLVLSVQVLGEFYNRATRAKKHNIDFTPISEKHAENLVENWSRFRVVQPTVQLLFKSIAVSQRYQLQFFDSCHVAAAVSAGCTNFLSQDLSHGQMIDGMKIFNPFI